MVWASALVLASSTAAVGTPIPWAWEDNGGTTYSATMGPTGDPFYMPNHKRVWVTADHSADKTIKYRSSVWLVDFNCKGFHSVEAFSAYDKDGKVVDSSDSLVSAGAIRPNTMFALLETVVCRSSDK